MAITINEEVQRKVMVSTTIGCESEAYIDVRAGINSRCRPVWATITLYFPDDYEVGMDISLDMLRELAEVLPEFLETVDEQLKTFPDKEE